MNTAPDRPARPPGFTLIEVLIVAAIIATLAGMLAPALLAAREKARRLNCASNLAQIGKAIKNFSLSHENFIPTNGTGPYNMEGWSGTAGRLIDEKQLDPGDVRVFRCPSSMDKPCYNAVTRRITGSSYAYNRMPAVLGVMRDSIALMADEDCIPLGSQGQVITPNHRHAGANVLLGSLKVEWCEGADAAVAGVAFDSTWPKFREVVGDNRDYLWKYDKFIGGYGGDKFAHFRETGDSYLVKGKNDPADRGFSYSEFIEE